MKPKQLRYPFQWSERRPCASDSVLFIPRAYNGHRAAGKPIWSRQHWFGNDRPLAIEYCSGNGSWICAKARRERDKNWLAIEQRFDRVSKIWSKLKNQHLDNLWVVCGEAHLFSQYYLRSCSVSAAYINFPDPWPKQRHAKHRLLSAAFSEQLFRILLPDAKVMIVTDAIAYAQQILQTMLSAALWRPCFRYPFYRTAMPGYGSSFFASLWNSKGRAIYYIQLQKR